MTADFAYSKAEADSTPYSKYYKYLHLFSHRHKLYTA